MPLPDEIAVLLDLLMPGDADWPAASAALRGGLLDALAPAERAWLTALARNLGRMPEGQRVAFLRDAEAGEPAAFRSMLTALYRSYYASPAVADVTTMLAARDLDEPPVEADSNLMAKVVATGAGRRRL
jgi:hypothetical protein